MAKRKSTQNLVDEIEGEGVGDAPVAMMEPGEQATMFPELDLTKPDEKEAYLAAKAFRKAKAQRDEILTTAKAKVDAARQRLVDAMGALHQEKFKHDGIRAEIIPGKAKVRVTAEDDDEEENDDGDE